MNNNEKEVIYAPIEIESADQLRALGIGWEDCETWLIGLDHVKVYLTPASAEVRDYLMQELRRRHQNRCRETRCMVQGKRGFPIRCPDQNHCEECPYGRNRGDRVYRTVSLDELFGEGFDCPSTENIAEIVENRIVLHDLFDRLMEVDPNYVRIIELLASGLTRAEIGRRLGLSRSVVSYALYRISEIAERYNRYG